MDPFNIDIEYIADAETVPGTPEIVDLTYTSDEDEPVLHANMEDLDFIDDRPESELSLESQPNDWDLEAGVIQPTVLVEDDDSDGVDVPPDAENPFQYPEWIFDDTFWSRFTELGRAKNNFVESYVKLHAVQPSQALVLHVEWLLSCRPGEAEDRFEHLGMPMGFPTRDLPYNGPTPPSGLP